MTTGQLKTHQDGNLGLIKSGVTVLVLLLQINKRNDKYICEAEGVGLRGGVEGWGGGGRSDKYT